MPTQLPDKSRCDLRWTGDIDANGMHRWVCINHYNTVRVSGPPDGMSERPTGKCA